MNTYVLTVHFPHGDIKWNAVTLYDAINYIPNIKYDFSVELNGECVYEFLRNPKNIPSDIWD